MTLVEKAMAEFYRREFEGQSAQELRDRMAKDAEYINLIKGDAKAAMQRRRFTIRWEVAARMLQERRV